MRLYTAIGTIVFLLLCSSCNTTQKKALKEWKIADNTILTEWALQVDPALPWPEYPRPDAKRDNWLNLNGLWDYAITDSESTPENWDGKILVPYPVESALSGVKRRVGKQEYLWYKRTFRIPGSWEKQQILLNFEASDWETTIYIDGQEAGKHKGAYDPFSINITEYLNRQKDHELLVRVSDPTDQGTQPRGKQVSVPGGIWYTPVTGIWQTVWIEPVPDSYITSFRSVSNIEAATITFSTGIVNPCNNKLDISILRDGKVIASGTGNSNDNITLRIPEPKLWTPENPFLYSVIIELKENQRTIDKITGYSGLRKISIGKQLMDLIGSSSIINLFIRMDLWTRVSGPMAFILRQQKKRCFSIWK